MTVGELLERAGSFELALWPVFLRIEDEELEKRRKELDRKSRQGR